MSRTTRLVRVGSERAWRVLHFWPRHYPKIPTETQFRPASPGAPGRWQRCCCTDNDSTMLWSCIKQLHLVYWYNILIGLFISFWSLSSVQYLRQGLLSTKLKTLQTCSKPGGARWIRILWRPRLRHPVHCSQVRALLCLCVFMRHALERPLSIKTRPDGSVSLRARVRVCVCVQILRWVRQCCCNDDSE